MRAVPPNTLKNIKPPDCTGYPYFDQWGTHPLNNSAVFNPVNAWRMAEVALLAYCNPTDAANILTRMVGFTGTFHGGSEAEYFVVRGGQDLIVAFRGTEADNLWGGVSDWMTDFDTSLDVDTKVPGIRVHSGFIKLLDEVWDALSNELAATAADPSIRIWFTGHSLGAALATLAAVRAEKRQIRVHAVYTYGSPRIGDGTFQKAVNDTGLQQKLFRIRNNADLVTRLPPFPKFQHVGIPSFIDNSGHFHQGFEPPAEQTLVAIAAAIAEVARLVPSLLLGNQNLIIDGALADHSATAYATHLLNQVI
jgi:triacylglycerol lipase